MSPGAILDLRQIANALIERTHLFPTRRLIVPDVPMGVGSVPLCRPVGMRLPCEVPVQDR